MKRETILTILLMVLCIVAIVGFMILGSYRNQQIQNGELKLVYQYGGDLWIWYKKKRELNPPRKVPLLIKAPLKYHRFYFLSNWGAKWKIIFY